MAAQAGVDLDAMTAVELTSLIEAAEGKLREKQDQTKAAFVAEMEERAGALGLSLKDLIGGGTPEPAARGRRPRRDAGKPVAAKYRGPNGETWSGRGRMPRWLADAEAKGRKREDFLI